MPDVWEGDWKTRVLSALKCLGFDDALDFAAAHPGKPIGQLFRYLRDVRSERAAPIALIQFVAVYFDQAERSGMLRLAIADALVRSLRQHLRKGWNKGSRLRERRADARADWMLPCARAEEFGRIGDRIWTALNELSPPDEWCPESAADPFIVNAFDREWPIS